MPGDRRFGKSDEEIIETLSPLMHYFLNNPDPINIKFDNILSHMSTREAQYDQLINLEKITTSTGHRDQRLFVQAIQMIEPYTSLLIDLREESIRARIEALAQKAALALDVSPKLHMSPETIQENKKALYDSIYPEIETLAKEIEAQRNLFEKTTLAIPVADVLNAVILLPTMNILNEQLKQRLTDSPYESTDTDSTSIASSKGSITPVRQTLEDFCRLPAAPTASV